MKSRSNLRDIIIKILYQTYIYDSTNTSYDILDIRNEFINYDDKFVDDAISYIKSNQEEISSIADKYLGNWTIDRLSKVDKAIISLAIYEIKCTSTPKIVCINEAICLAKVYSDDSVVKMINAMLDKYYHEEFEE